MTGVKESEIKGKKQNKLCREQSADFASDPVATHHLSRGHFRRTRPLNASHARFPDVRAHSIRTAGTG